MNYVPHILLLDIPIHIATGHQGRKLLRTGPKPPQFDKVGLVPRVSRLLALAWRLEGLIQRGKAKDFAELADLCHVSRGRMSQVMNLLNLAPDLQEAILFLPLTQGERETVPEREVRAIALEPDWGRQRELWKALIENEPSIAPESREVTRGEHAQTAKIEASFRLAVGDTGKLDSIKDASVEKKAKESKRKEALDACMAKLRTSAV